MSDEEELKTIGWNAIDAALKPLYAGQVPKHYGTIISRRLGGKEPLDGVSVYQRSDPVSHWHYITFGFTELYDKESNDPSVNGFGFELTFRLLRGDEEDPPAWPLSFLQNIARYVFATGNRFTVGHYLNCNGPIALGTETAIRAVLFAPDPELREIDCEFGSARFLQVVGITVDEEVALSSWNAEGVLRILMERIPLLCTDLKRQSTLADPIAAAQLEKGIRTEGSNTGDLYVTQLSWTIENRLFRSPEAIVSFGASQVGFLKAVVPGRLPHGRELFIKGQDAGVILIPSRACSWEKKDLILELHLTPEAISQLVVGLESKEKTLRLAAFPGLVISIRKSEIKDQDGKIIQVIG